MNWSSELLGKLLESMNYIGRVSGKLYEINELEQFQKKISVNLAIYIPLDRESSNSGNPR